MQININAIKNCYGCGVCAVACSRNILEITLNSDGFYEPRIKDPGACNQCGLCLKVCSFIANSNAREAVPMKSYAGWSRDPAIRSACSSGGIGYEIAKKLLSAGYAVCGVRYSGDGKNRAEHFIASDEEQLEATVGSKYMQSYTVEAFRQIDRKKRYLITGPPCQIASLRRYVRTFHLEDNVILMDFFCHGTPSKLVWDKYLEKAIPPKTSIQAVRWRDKSSGWHNSYRISFRLDNSAIQRPADGFQDPLQGKMFYNFFFSDACLGKACYDCKYKYDRSSADIRIGDLWGNTFQSDEKGVSAVVAFTSKGIDILRQLDSCVLNEYPFETVAEGQMKDSPQEPPCRDRLFEVLRDKRTSLDQAYAIIEKHLKRLRWKNRLLHPGRSFAHLLKKL